MKSTIFALILIIAFVLFIPSILIYKIIKINNNIYILKKEAEMWDSVIVLYGFMGQKVDDDNDPIYQEHEEELDKLASVISKHEYLINNKKLSKQIYLKIKDELLEFDEKESQEFINMINWLEKSHPKIHHEIMKLIDILCFFAKHNEPGYKKIYDRKKWIIKYKVLKAISEFVEED